MKTIAITFSILLLMQGTLRAQDSKEGIEYFEKHIRPVLVERCYKCHAAGAEKIKGKLLLDTKAATLKGGENGPAIIPGNLDKSLLITAIRGTHEDLAMPPKEPLTKEQIAHFEVWVKMGAPDPRTGGPSNPAAASSYDYDKAKQFWSFQPIKQTTIPLSASNWPINAVDQFVFARMRGKGLTPVGLADRRTLIRRATYDLTGLPPTPQEVEAFLSDKSADAYARLIDRLLASPAYGEKWARLWLDVVRYADTSGCNSDYPIPDAWRYRNWVIDAFNADKPYDQFLREQLAGDLMPQKDTADRNNKIIATGYLAIARRFGSRNNEFHLTIEDIIDNVGKGMLGISISCARCHDHKFDPIPTSDYYALYGILSSTQYAFPGTEIYHHAKDLTALGGQSEIDALGKFETELAGLDDRYENLLREKLRLESSEKLARDLAAKGEKPATQPATTKPLRLASHVRAEMEDIRKQQERLENNPPKLEKAFAVRDAAKIADAKVQIKGEPGRQGVDVPRGFLTILGGQKLSPDDKTSGRLQLANWITDSKNPLTARVMVNRIWQGHFGKGIVQTPNDFGIRGAAPAHPELLDHLAGQFINSNWSVKAMHRQIMLSRTYQLSCNDDAHNAAVDFSNDFLWRFNPRRQSAEELRDSVLQIAGALDRRTAKNHPFPAESQWKFTQHKPFYANYETNHRSIYLMQQRIRKQAYLAIFDGADTNASTPNRTISTTAIQALWMMNDGFFHDMSSKLAAQISESATEPDQQVRMVYQLALGRAPTADESAQSLEFLNQIEQSFDRPGDHSARAALASFARVLLAGNEFVFIE